MESWLEGTMASVRCTNVGRSRGCGADLGSDAMVAYRRIDYK